eukprot:2303355-Amphidinium_carterae.1
MLGLTMCDYGCTMALRDHCLLSHMDDSGTASVCMCVCERVKARPRYLVLRSRVVRWFNLCAVIGQLVTVRLPILALLLSLLV